MNPNVTRLYEIAQKTSRIILGLMSGTSRDGLDLVLCRFNDSGTNTTFEILEFASKSYPVNLLSEINQVFAKQNIELQQLSLLHAELGIWYGNTIHEQLNSWKMLPDAVDLIASHGQTIYHAPKHFHGIAEKPNASLQIGDSDHIAQLTGIITVSDFRQKHLAAGGEGAPLAVYGDYLLFSDASEDRVLLNIGGISNFTYLQKNDLSSLLTTDCGPGNTLIDWAANTYFSVGFDDSGKIAASGKIHPDFLERLKNHPFLKKPIPRSTGPEEFDALFVVQCLGGLNVAPNDIIRTLSEFTVLAVVETISRATIGCGTTVYVSGGGEKNAFLMQRIQDELKTMPIASFKKLGVDPQAKEGLLFAALANESVAASKPIGNSKNGIPEAFMGKISFPL